MIKCPECNTALPKWRDLKLWDRVFCPACGVELEVVEISPFTLESVVDLDWIDEDAEDEIIS